MEMVSKPFRCENVLELLEWFEMSDCYVLILEWPSPCTDVHEFCKHHKGRLSEPVARKIMRQVVQAACHCCDCGVFHGDIKAENLLINTDTLDVKLKEFGCGDLFKDTPYTRYAGKCIIGMRKKSKRMQWRTIFCDVPDGALSLSFTQVLGLSAHLSGYVRESIWVVLPPSGVWVYSCLTWCAETCPFIMRTTTFIRTYA